MHSRLFLHVTKAGCFNERGNDGRPLRPVLSHCVRVPNCFQILAIRYYRIMAYNQSRDEHDAEEPMDDDKWVAHCTIDFNNHINIMQFSV